jgi:7,8-dihydropterin-6-yl-methyl-4-(beta-D-ribofuranosyl)aminobenzene 5'-phosphate synthase
MRELKVLAWLLAGVVGSCSAPPERKKEPPPDRITILYDAFGTPSALTQDWGFSALIEISGRRVLFDTGNNSEIFAHNVAALGVDLTRLDFVVLSHRHGDHTDGLRHLLRVNPDVTIYTPRDLYFGGPTPTALYRRSVPSLPADMRYFGGRPPDLLPHGTPWKGARFVQIEKATEVTPGFHLIPTPSQVPGTLELNELSLGIRTPRGLVIVCGCSHPGIEKILDSAASIDPALRLVAGGLHLGTTADAAIESIAVSLRDKHRLQQIAPGHCTGEPAFAALRQAFGDRYLFAGLGTVIELR